MAKIARSEQLVQLMQLAGALALLSLSPAAAQTPQATPTPAPAYTPTSLVVAPDTPRTRDGHPDLSDTIWTTNFFPVFEATPLADQLVLSDAEAKEIAEKMVKGLLASDDPDLKVDPEAPLVLGGVDGLPVVRGQHRSRLLVLPADGKLPWTKQGEAQSKKGVDSDAPANNPEERPSSERCITILALPPIPPAPMLDPIQIIEAPGYVLIHTEFGDEVRLIPLSDHHANPALAPRLGDSIAHWEGDTLVIETVGSPAFDAVRDEPMNVVVNPDATVIERLTRLSRDELLYQFTVIDPKTYSTPWLAEYSLHPTAMRLFPYSCHEGNYSLPNILKGQRVKDRTPAPPAPIKPAPK